MKIQIYLSNLTIHIGGNPDKGIASVLSALIEQPVDIVIDTDRKTLVIEGGQ